jgi:F-type H+-transporting ATPase subunit epsilon
LNLFTVELFFTYKCLYKGPATLVMAPGVDGELGILTRHMGLLASLKQGKVRIFVNDEPEINFEISHGYLEMLNNVCSIIAVEKLQKNIA